MCKEPDAGDANFSAHRSAIWQVGSFGGIADEVQALKRDKNVLMLELVRLRQQQQVTFPCTEAPDLGRAVTRTSGLCHFTLQA